MALVSSKQLLLDAQKGRYAVPAFNIENMEMAMAVIEAAQEMRSPVIVQTTPSTVKFAGTDMLYAMVFALAKQVSIPVVLHMDHGDSYDLIIKAIRSGYTSVMYDGSKYLFEENVRQTKTIVDLAKAIRLPVEAELGKVGGKEDDKVVSEKDANLTDPDEAKKFVEKTNVDSLAVAIGTAHGLYKGEPKIDFDRLEKIREVVHVPLVLHGGTGIPDDFVKRSITLGICKANFATELRIAATTGVREALADTAVFDPKVYMKTAKESVKEMVKSKILICGSNNKL